jgi:glyoxylase-like metal-dependent hydrolase (beta-lactamase superfamily II)
LHDWPLHSATIDLGGRRLKVIPSPGHHESAISVLDPYTGCLFSGDTVYPGRLYVPDMQAFLSTLSRLTALAESGHVTQVLGSHIEFDRDGRDYPLGAREHPDEESPFMPPDVLVAVRDVALRVAESPGVHPGERFAIYNGNRVRDRLRLVARSVWARLRAG